LPFCHAELRAPKPKPSAYPKTINTLGDHIRTRRLDLGLLQQEVGGRIGVDGSTITNWEHNATVPVIRYIPAIIQFLGYDPFPPTNSFTERLIVTRKALGLSQQKMAVKLGVDPATLQGWETGQHRPSPKSMARITKILLTQRFLPLQKSLPQNSQTSSHPHFCSRMELMEFWRGTGLAVDDSRELGLVHWPICAIMAAVPEEVTQSKLLHCLNRSLPWQLAGDKLLSHPTYNYI